MSIGFFLKKVIATLLMPLPVILMLLAAAFVVLWWTKRQRLGMILLGTGIVLLYVLSLPFLPYAALTSLEEGENADDVSLQRAGIEWVVVLSGSSPGDPGYSSVNRIGSHSLVRLAEGIRVWRRLPNARLIVSGGDWEGGEPAAKVMRDAAIDLGVDPARILVDDASWDTKQSAANVAEMVDGERIALVTSASHMNRALADFRGEGLEVVPLRAGYSYTKPIEMTPFTFGPIPGNLSAVTTAWHEFLGTIWSRLSA